MFLFVSSYDYKDITISQAVVDNALRIDRITGPRICYLHFCENTATISHASQTQHPLVCRAINQDSFIDGVGLTANIRIASMSVADIIYFDSIFLPAFALIRCK